MFCRARWVGKGDLYGYATGATSRHGRPGGDLERMIQLAAQEGILLGFRVYL